MMRLFGTDGIRSIAGCYPLDSKTVYMIGYAFGKYVNKEFPATDNILIGMDTRKSGQSIYNWLAAGLDEGNVKFENLGIQPTPTIAFMTMNSPNTLGCVISASHNPSQFNGIKFISNKGTKLSEVEELKIEEILFKSEIEEPSVYAEYPQPEQDLQCDAYINKLQDEFADILFPDKTAVLDTSNGAFYKIAPKVLNNIFPNLIVINSAPDGDNINLNCGSQHLEGLKQAVLNNNAFIGISFDGDGDRLILVDENGIERDGDFILGIIAKYLKEKNQLENNTLALTVMANLGLINAMKKLDIHTEITKVGDKYVYETMKKNNYSIGGEQSGHIIINSHLPNGDGLYSALTVLKILFENNSSLSEESSLFTKYPQKLINLEVKEKTDYNKIKEIANTIAKCEDMLKDDGRVLIRYSGTEPLLRIMVESITEEMNDKILHLLISAFKENLQ